MPSRKRMKRSRDIGVFKKAYNKTKKINHATASQQGGIRL